MQIARQFEYIAQNGFYHSNRNRSTAAFTPKPGSHNDGGLSGLFYGGIGAPAFSRSLDGVFNRWHLQPGYHAYREIRSAQLSVWWQPHTGEDAVRSSSTGDQGSGSSAFEPGGCRLLSLYSLGIEGVRPISAEGMEAGVLFPITVERYSEEVLPFEIFLRMYSPITPDNLSAAALPVVYMDIELQNRSLLELDVSVALFWPNQLGWRQPHDASENETVCSWPARSNYGNINQPLELPFGKAMPSTAVLQTRTPELPVRRDLEGEVLIAAYTSNSEALVSRELTYKTEATGTGVAPEQQPFTFPWVLRCFSKKGRFPQREESWPARCHEGIGSAVAIRAKLEPRGNQNGDQCTFDEDTRGGSDGSTARLHFLLVHDLPLVEFGGGRVWKRAYCDQFGSSGRNSIEIASAAVAGKEAWLSSIVEWQRSIECGALINDLYFLVGGGTAWVSGVVDPADVVLGGNSHFALLEGFDTGYFYYNTFDLWVYAFPALMAGWQPLAEGVFNDFLRSVDIQDSSDRIIYRPGERRQVLVPDKIPHDLGSAMEDPWHALNGYSWRDDPNVWRDHNPGFILSYYLFHQYAARSIGVAEYRVLERAAAHMRGQDRDGDGLPEHGEFGDSTWDALSLKGIGAYSGALAIGALAVMAKLGEQFGSDPTAVYRQLLHSAVSTYRQELWNGEYFNSSSRGKYRNAIQADALFGQYLADLAGLRVNSVEMLPLSQIRSHLLAVYEYNFRGYKSGRVGPLLVSNPSLQNYARDGGEDLQLGEVIVGSAWAYAAMLDYYGLAREAKTVEAALVRTLYERSGLQFRTPAAWDGEGRFRAPLNMRPLASWFLHLNKISGRRQNGRRQ